jgi:hypothetical protein
LYLALVEYKLFADHELHNCEPFDGNCVVTQCFKCYKYGHAGHNCRNTQRCGVCAAPGHVTNDCLGKEDRTKHQCVNCRGKHQSWARECPERKKQTAAALEAYSTRPVRYQVGAELPVQTKRTFIFDSAPAPPPAPTVEEEGDDQWIPVGSRRTASSPQAGPPEQRRKGPRRLLGSTNASKGTKDIRDVFDKLYE